MDTSCKNCVFKDENMFGEQHGCKLSKIKSLAVLGYQIEKDDSDSFVIKNRLCQFCRHKESDWAKSLTEDKYVEAINKDVKIEMSAFIVLDKSYEFSCFANEFIPFFAPLSKKYQSIYILNLENENVDLIAEQLIKNKYNNWNIINFLYGQNLEQAIDETFAKLEPSVDFYAVIFPSEEFKSYFSTVNNIVNEYMMPLLALTPSGATRSFVVNTTLHRMMDGNKPMADANGNEVTNLLDKIEKNNRYTQNIEAACKLF